MYEDSLANFSKIVNTIDKYYTYEELVNTGIGYYKMSKSTNEIANKCCENFTKTYIEGTIAESINGHGLSFTPELSAICCIPYGDQLTKFRFDQSGIEIMGDGKYSNIGNAIPELLGLRLLVEENYSLSNPETLMKIIKMSHPKYLKIAVNNPLMSMSIGNHLEKLNFRETKTFWEYAIENIKGQSSIQIYENVINLIEGTYKSWLNLS